MKLSKIGKSIQPSLTRELFNLAKKYDNVIDLTLGDPDIAPSKLIKDAAVKSINAGKTRYSANAGLISLREAIANCFNAEYGLKVKPETEIIATVGGMEALFLALSCIIDDNDEVIVIAPYYVNYIEMIKLCGGKPVIVYTKAEDGFQCSAEQIEKLITGNTVSIIINTPCNPTGMVLSEKSLKAVASLAEKYDLTVISDEVYKTLLYDKKKHESIIRFDGMKDRTVIVDSLSKRFAMTGYRLGYAIGPTELISCMTKMQENVVACAPLPSQYAGIAAYSLCAKDTSIRDVFEKRRNYLANAINEINSLHCHIPQGAFYLFVNIASTGLDSLSFAYQLLEQEQVAVVPGKCYGENYDNYIRIAYTLDIPYLKDAVVRIHRFISQFEEKI